ncbi:signal peptidase I SipW [Oceanobacillus manasiensis]|uniref:signal peptidase I SipW n=1 Tax=Oceanobacillus manasiensis TaxID=586413 RepID=UPI0005A73BEF|nr:signal peptidase I [Oceanobacillus manasiensis]
MILKRVSNILYFIILAVLLCALLVVGLSKASGNEVSLFGYQVKSVLSGSMEPGIQTGSVIAIETGGDMQRFSENDVITYRAEDNILITHRIVEVLDDGQQYRTKGDANNGADISPVRSENVVGKYSGFTIPYAGYVLQFATSPQGAALLMIVPGVLLLCYAFLTIRRTLKHVKHLLNEKKIGTE